MSELEKAKELIDKNRLIVALGVAWIVVSNLLYFSQVGEFSCFDIRTLAASSAPDWIILWNKLTLGYVSLYGTIHEPYQSRAVICSQADFGFSGYFFFVSLPILAIILLTIAIRWVRRT
jgi:hypothetical protein